MVNSICRDTLASFIALCVTPDEESSNKLMSAEVASAPAMSEHDDGSVRDDISPTASSGRASTAPSSAATSAASSANGDANGDAEGGAEWGAPAADTERTAALLRRFDSAVHTMRQLSGETRLPFVDVKLYEKYAVDAVGPPGAAARHAAPQHVNRIEAIVGALSDHKYRTLETLHAIALREKTMATLRELQRQAKEGLSTLDIQALALRELYDLQRQTLDVVQCVIRWRSNLTRPYTFLHNGENYVLSMVMDAAELERGELGQVLPLQLVAFPLLSNVPSIALFKHDKKTVTYPLKRTQAAAVAAVSPALQKKLVGAEAYLHKELTQQLGLHKELLSLVAQGRTVPLLQVPGAMPVSASRQGVRVHSAEIVDRLQAALMTSLKELVSMPGTADGAGAEEGGEEDEQAGDDAEVAVTPVEDTPPPAQDDGRASTADSFTVEDGDASS
jgi:hypothetical protein